MVDLPALSHVTAIAPPCPFVAAGCGGCGWQHVAVDDQRALKVGLVTEALRRGGVADPVVDEGPALPATGYRTTVRGVADADGRVALRRARSHELIAVPECQVAHPLVAEVLAGGRFPPGAEVTIRASVATGDRLVIVDLPDRPAPDGPPADERVPDAGIPAALGDPGRPGPPGPGAAEGQAGDVGVPTEVGDAGSTRAPDAGVAAGEELAGDVGVPTDAGGTPAPDAGVAAGEEPAGDVGVPPGVGGAGGAAASVSGVGEGPAGGVEVPDRVRVVTGAELAAGKRAWAYEVVAGVRLRVSARSFFQSGPAGAEALVAAVRQALDGAVGPGRHLVDLYGGVGLFAATIGIPAGSRTTVVEASAPAAADARVNMAAAVDLAKAVATATGGAGPDVAGKVVRSDVARWHPRRAHALVADPPRAGLGRGGVRAVARSGARRLALVSCDAGALGRDTKLLLDAGYRFVGAVLVDQFVGTPHVEVVSCFDRARG